MSSRQALARAIESSFPTEPIPSADQLVASSERAASYAPLVGYKGRPCLRRCQSSPVPTGLPDEFIAAVETALADTTTRAQRSAAMQGETWAARVAQVVATIDDVLGSKQP